MGIQPIDLQTLYAQLEKVGKIQGDMRHLFASELEKSQQANKEDAIRRQQTVQKIEAGDADKITVNKDGGRQSDSSKNDFSEQKNASDADNNSSYYIKDPLLGKKIDISG